MLANMVIILHKKDLRLHGCLMQCMQVTWEERWHTILSELELDVGRRCVTLRAEAARVVAAEEQKATAAAALRGPGASSKGDSAAPGGLGMAMLGGKWTPGGVGATAAAAGGGPSWADRARGAGGASGGGSGPAGVPVPIPVPVVPVPVPVPVPVSGTLLEAGTSGPQPAASEPSGSPPSESAPSEAVDEGGRVSVLSVRYTALMSPVVHALERALRACQSCEPETPAERRFVQEVGGDRGFQHMSPCKNLVRHASVFAVLGSKHYSGCECDIWLQHGATSAQSGYPRRCCLALLQPSQLSSHPRRRHLTSWPPSHK
jgi:hypothetical protein